MSIDIDGIGKDEGIPNKMYYVKKIIQIKLFR